MPLHRGDAPLGAPPVEYRYLTEFQSHELGITIRMRSRASAWVSSPKPHGDMSPNALKPTSLEVWSGAGRLPPAKAVRRCIQGSSCRGFQRERK